MGRWDHLFDLKPIPLVEHLLEEIAKLLANDLRGWPPPIQDFDPETGKQFEPLLAPDCPRPDPLVFEEGFRVARWELEREIGAVDQYMRTRKWQERGLAPDARLGILFISRWLVEQLLSLREQTQGRITRTQLIECLDRAGHLVRSAEWHSKSKK